VTALQGYRPLRRLVPFFRPYLPHVTLLVLVALAYSQCNAQRALLVQPLVNKVLLRGGEVEGQLLDERLASSARERAKAIGDALPTPDEATVEALRRDPDLGLGPMARELGREDPFEADLPHLLRRTHRALLVSADDPGLPLTSGHTWSELWRAVELQRRAVALVGAAPHSPDRHMAAALSLEARQRAFDITYATARKDLYDVVLKAIALAIGLALTHYVMFYLSRSLTSRMFVDLQNHMAARLLGLSVKYYEGERRGDLLSRLTADLGLTSSVVGILAGDLLIQGITMAVLVVNALLISPQLSIIVAGVGLTILLPLRRWGKRMRRHSRRRQGATGDVLELLQQMLAGVRVVKAFQREAHEDQRFTRQVTLATDAQVQAIRAREAAKTWLQFMNDIVVPVAFMGGGYLVLKRTWDLDAGTFGAFLGLVLQMYLPTKALGEAYGTLNESLPSVERVFEVLDARPDVVDRAGAVPAGPLRESIRYDGVVFSYGGDRDVLVDISFEAKAGTLNAIVGATGSGKSTLVDLLCRYRDPTGGRILIDGRDLSDLQLGTWLDRVAIVPQHSFLFNDTVRENIRYGRLDATDAEVEEAARLAGVHDDVVALEGGYDYVVGERGSKLSGGQVQRLALARAMVKRPDVLILDEAMSALDNRTERLIQQALEAMASRCTTFAIAHRLSTVRKADQILVLDAGRLVERGRHEELVAKDGLYAKLVRMQQLTNPDDA
jgi:ATP-binding cassette, subfamily B, bacterial MsbA